MQDADLGLQAALHACAARWWIPSCQAEQGESCVKGGSLRRMHAGLVTSPCCTWGWHALCIITCSVPIRLGAGSIVEIQAHTAWYPNTVTIFRKKCSERGRAFSWLRWCVISMRCLRRVK